MAACDELMALADGLEDAVEGVLAPADEGDEAHGGQGSRAGGVGRAVRQKAQKQKWTAFIYFAFTCTNW